MVEQAKVRVEDPPNSHQGKGDNGRFQGGQSDVNHLLPAVRAVNDGGLVISPVDAHQSGVVDDAVVAQALPQVYQDEDERPVLGFGVPGDGLQPQGGQDGLVQKSGLRAKEGIDQITDHHDRD